jgi:transcription termination/antitermination protein NusA
MSDEQDISFGSAIDQLVAEKGISKDKVLDTIEHALAAAYRKDYGQRGEDIRAEFNEEDASARIFKVMTVVELAEDQEEVANPAAELTLESAKKDDNEAEIGKEYVEEVTPDDPNYGRVAAQTAKQVIIQRIREAEREAVHDEFKDKEGEIISGIVQRIEGDTVFVDVGRTTGVLFPSEQVRGERYRINQRIRVYVVKVELATRGPEIVLSRSHPGMLRRMFELEVPEIFAGSVEIKGIAREASARSKVAVYATEEGIDPVGACIGQRGTRIQTIIAELSGEKIDIIQWDSDAARYIANALSPARVVAVDIFEDEKRAVAHVGEEQLSLAIGKRGQNVRLAAKLTGWRIDIVKAGEEANVGEAVMEAGAAPEDETAEAPGNTPETTDDEKDKEAIEPDAKDSSTTTE